MNAPKATTSLQPPLPPPQPSAWQDCAGAPACSPPAHWHSNTPLLCSGPPHAPPGSAAVPALTTNGVAASQMGCHTSVLPYSGGGTSSAPAFQSAFPTPGACSSATASVAMAATPPGTDDGVGGCYSSCAETGTIAPAAEALSMLPSRGSGAGSVVMTMAASVPTLLVVRPAAATAAYDTHPRELVTALSQSSNCGGGSGGGGGAAADLSDGGSRVAPVVVDQSSLRRPPPPSLRGPCCDTPAAPMVPTAFAPPPSPPSSPPPPSVHARQLARAAAAIAAAAMLGQPPPDLEAMGLLPPGYPQCRLPLLQLPAATATVVSHFGSSPSHQQNPLHQIHQCQHHHRCQHTAAALNAVDMGGGAVADCGDGGGGSGAAAATASACGDYFGCTGGCSCGGGSYAEYEGLDRSRWRAAQRYHPYGRGACGNRTCASGGGGGSGSGGVQASATSIAGQQNFQKQQQQRPCLTCHACWCCRTAWISPPPPSPAPPRCCALMERRHSITSTIPRKCCGCGCGQDSSSPLAAAAVAMSPSGAASCGGVSCGGDNSCGGGVCGKHNNRGMRRGSGELHFGLRRVEKGFSCMEVDGAKQPGETGGGSCGDGGSGPSIAAARASSSGGQQPCCVGLAQVAARPPVRPPERTAGRPPPPLPPPPSAPKNEFPAWTPISQNRPLGCTCPACCRTLSFGPYSDPSQAPPASASPSVSSPPPPPPPSSHPSQPYTSAPSPHTSLGKPYGTGAPMVPRCTLPCCNPSLTATAAPPPPPTPLSPSPPAWTSSHCSLPCCDPAAAARRGWEGPRQGGSAPSSCTAVRECAYDPNCSTSLRSPVLGPQPGLMLPSPPQPPRGQGHQRCRQYGGGWDDAIVIVNAVVRVIWETGPGTPDVLSGRCTMRRGVAAPVSAGALDFVRTGPPPRFRRRVQRRRHKPITASGGGPGGGAGRGLTVRHFSAAAAANVVVCNGHLYCLPGNVAVSFPILTQWTVVITDPAAAAQVLAVVPGRTHNYTLVDEVLGGPGKISMFGTRDEAHWRNVRKATAPAFSMANVRRYFGGVLSASGELLESLELDQLDAGYVDAEPYLQRMMLRATLEGLFEVPDARALPGFDLLVPRILLLMAEANRQIVDPLWALWYRTPLAPLLSKHVSECRAAVREVRAFHTATAARLLDRPDPPSDNTLLWACLHRLRHHITGARLTPTQLHPEVGMYTTAGFDTTASTVGWCLYAAALHPDQQQKVADELQQACVFGNGAVVVQGEGEEGGAAAGGSPRPGIRQFRLDPTVCPSPEDLVKLPYLTAFVNEAMRLYPTTAVAAERVSPDRPVAVGPFTLPPGVVLWPLVYGIHMSDANWDEPEAFRMERWLEDPRCAFARGESATANTNTVTVTTATTTSRTNTRPRGSQQQQRQQQQQTGDPQAAGGGGVSAVQGGPGASGAPRRFLPFADGPKNCVGQNFGLVVVRAVLALLLSRYRVALHGDMGLERPELPLQSPSPSQTLGTEAAKMEGMEEEEEGGEEGGWETDVLDEGAEAAAAEFDEGGNGGCGSSPKTRPQQQQQHLQQLLAEHTARLTRVAVVTKLSKLRLVMTPRD
ncbi:hypothetical protein VOLCADRAFT_118116 [Volvox carteri f. nagariensis]|uniref:Cytochrome P450 n=1 Tax=Volvox carteri f. nagariensis TaxID=3068 RepID=D8U1X1_VOLCA|nr:uncharacterized protein VOLCADRAFT_118116 [Volvox carteri f. nagariensis]EFJ46255.1 hypothetical protein VOLCADRAFT_118116 [Volvox carteri f. nagariensis]|eukprot:XP_002952702.1 hypothetical protein VOLCADRAFT_118116 [Volvox carteri f. nagariensis]